MKSPQKVPKVATIFREESLRPEVQLPYSPKRCLGSASCTCRAVSPRVREEANTPRHLGDLVCEWRTRKPTQRTRGSTNDVQKDGAIHAADHPSAYQIRERRVVPEIGLRLTKPAQKQQLSGPVNE